MDDSLAGQSEAPESELKAEAFSFQQTLCHCREKTLLPLSEEQKLVVWICDVALTGGRLAIMTCISRAKARIVLFGASGINLLRFSAVTAQLTPGSQ